MLTYSVESMVQSDRLKTSQSQMKHFLETRITEII